MADITSVTPASSVTQYTTPKLATELYTRNRLRVKEIIQTPQKGEEFIGKDLIVCGWARTIRQQQKDTLAFIALNDGSTFDSIQVVATKDDTENFADILSCGGIGASLKVTGTVVESPNKKNQSVELKAKKVVILGKVDANKYPLKKTKHAHSMEFLRDNAHLRSRTNLIGAVARVRNALAYATHKFFNDRGFLYVHTPLITASDGEGAGEMFGVSTIANNITDKSFVKSKDGSTPQLDFSKDFFSKPTFLTVTGQLNVETYACGLSDCYTFGPTFRAENSHTSRHLAEFWMIEPEMAFAELDDLMNSAEDYIKFCLAFVIQNCATDIDFFDLRVEKGLKERLKNVLDTEFARISYTEAIELLKDPKNIKAGGYETPFWGMDLHSEHERFLTEKIYKKPVIVVNYPASFKAFYMKRNDEKINGEDTVQGMDILVPKIGELVGGSVREERLEVLEELMAQKGLDKDAYEWYLDLRRFGTVPHGGFGLGFERLVMFATGVENIRDVIPFPRAPGQCSF